LRTASAAAAPRRRFERLIMATRKRKPVAKPAAKRPAGKPRRADRPVTPEALERIEEMHLKGRSLREIGDAIGITPAGVHYHLEHTIRPKWRAAAVGRLETELAKIDLIERIAHERFQKSTEPKTRQQREKALRMGGAAPVVVKRVLEKTTRTGEACWIELAKWCVEQRAKIFGHYAPEKHQIVEGAPRFAGRPAGEVVKEQMALLAKKAQELYDYEKQVAKAREQG
jgi:hypothetical protein